MSRRQSVAFFLGDVGFLSDPKFRRLARLIPDPDEFNSAVGAYWIALAASRRNGSHELDAAAETDSKYLDQLRAVGLLGDGGFPVDSWQSWAATSPQQAAAGRARAEGAKRDEHGHFLPAPSSALDRSSSAVQPSPPLYSTPNERGPGENAPSSALTPRGERTFDRMQQRRIDYYLKSGIWDPDYGPEPRHLLEQSA